MVAPIVGRCLRRRCHGLLLVLATHCRYCSLTLLVRVDHLCFIGDLDRLAGAIGGEAWQTLEVAIFDCFAPCGYGWLA